MTARAWRTATGVALVALLLSSSACSVSGLQLARDGRVEIVEPRPGERVSLPMVVEWTVDDLDVAEPGTGDGHYFAVFVDRPPLRPGASLLSLVDDACLRAANGCATREYFATRNVYLTADTSVVLSSFPETAGRSADRVLHTVDIVLMDEENRRAGESVFSTSFRVEPF